MPDPLEVIHENPGAENLSYRYVITNEDASEILAISPSATIDLDGAGPGICQIWGWSYRGLADNGASFIGSPLADLDALDCSDISDNAINVTRLTGDECENLSTNDFNANAFSVFPNPTNDIINVTSSLDFETTIEIYDTQGRSVYRTNSNLSNTLQINMSSFNSGLYLLNITNKANNTAITKRIIKTN